MASKINADEFVDREGEGKPTLPQGVVLSGVTTITTAVVDGNEVANSTGINVGIITSTHFAGNLTGDVNAGIVTVTSQTVIGSAVTISSQGIDIGAGVITATSYAGGGGNLTGIGATIMTWEYNPDPYDTAVTLATGIGITFNQRIKAGSGNITLREDSSSGTLVENFGIGSSVTISNNELSFTPTSELSPEKTYYIELPSGVITNMAGDSYDGTAYTFSTVDYTYSMYVWGPGTWGQTGRNNIYSISSPTQLPGTKWSTASGTKWSSYFSHAARTDGTLWFQGRSFYGVNGSNLGDVELSSPTQIPGTTWLNIDTEQHAIATKTDGTLWAWGRNHEGQHGVNDTVDRSSPIQIPGTNWSTAGHEDGITASKDSCAAIKTDGTLWTWGENTEGVLGVNDNVKRSSPVQIPGTTWSTINGYGSLAATKTDGTLWVWGLNNYGQLGVGNEVPRSSPTQIPGTTWSYASENNDVMMGLKTDGTLWAWGNNSRGELGQNSKTIYSSPRQVGSDTTWSSISAGPSPKAIKTDGTIWTWGSNDTGKLGTQQTTDQQARSSPVQMLADNSTPGAWYRVSAQGSPLFAFQRTTS